MTDRRINLNLKKKNGERKTEEKKDWSNLLPELLGLIMSCLTVKDKFRASAVCKAWYKASVSIQIKDRHPWLMIYSLNVKRPFELYDPLQDKTYIMKFPEIAGMKKVYYSKDGWLLMCKDRSSGLSFFNPFTRKHITLSNCQIYNECVMFTCAPTSNSCLVFGLTNIGNSCNVIAINTCRLGETKWNTTRFISHEPYFSYDSKIVFSGGLFYCLDGFGSLAAFDPAKLTWKIHYPKNGIPLLLGTYLVENKGDIFLLNPLCEKPRLFKLNRDDSWFWEEKENIGEGLTIFASVCASECRSNLTSHMRNKLFWSDIHHPAIHNYCFNQGRYLSNISYNPFCIWRTSFENVWIEHPKQSLEFI